MSYRKCQFRRNLQLQVRNEWSTVPSAVKCTATSVHQWVVVYIYIYTVQVLSVRCITAIHSLPVCLHLYPSLPVTSAQLRQLLSIGRTMYTNHQAARHVQRQRPARLTNRQQKHWTLHLHIVIACFSFERKKTRSRRHTYSRVTHRVDNKGRVGAIMLCTMLPMHDLHIRSSVFTLSQYLCLHRQCRAFFSEG